jgi:eukaryotic-like serine/threonine-protein kinase
VTTPPDDPRPRVGLTVAPGRHVGRGPGAGRWSPADAATGLLRRAAAAGLLNPGKLRVEADLDPLRSRPDFRWLLADVAFPAEPFAPAP